MYSLNMKGKPLLADRSRIERTRQEEHLMKKTAIALILLGLILVISSGCELRNPLVQPPSAQNETKVPSTSSSIKTPEVVKNSKPDAVSDPSVPNKPPVNQPAAQKPVTQTPVKVDKKPAVSPSSPTEAIQVVADPSSITVLVNKQFSLPKTYVPSDLVFPKVPFLSSATPEKRKMRKEAAEALEQMFAAAKKDGIILAGVSAYRSYQTQKALFEYYAKKDGEAKARTYSAVGGTSEHETGLAIDVSGLNGKCPATDCFAGTPEAKWLAAHAYEYGFIIRYPKGKESITGYQYEPWHLRYVGLQIAQEIHTSGVTLEEYVNTFPVEKEEENLQNNPDPQITQEIQGVQETQIQLETQEQQETSKQ